MRDDALGILSRETRDEREEPVPERERVSGMQAAVRELGDPFEREVVELEQLACAGQMEEPVALHGRRRHPDGDSDDRAPEEGPRAAGHDVGRRPATEEAERHTGRRHDDEEDERQRQRRPERERDRQRREDDDERPGEARREAPHAQRTGDEPPGREHGRGRERELEVQGDNGHRPSRAATSPDASQPAPSR